MTAPTFPCFIKKTQINPEFYNFSVFQGWDDFRDQSLVCQDISKFSCFVNNTTDIFVLIGIFRNSVNSVKVRVLSTSITICGIDQEVLTNMSINIFRRHFVERWRLTRNTSGRVSESE